MNRAAKKHSEEAVLSLIYVSCLEEFLISLEQVTRKITADTVGSHQS